MIGARRPGAGSDRPLVGRSDIWTEVDELLDRTQGGKGGGLLLTGPGGMGKTELLRATLARAERREFRVASARALPVELPAPFSLVRDLLASHARSEEPAGEMPGVPTPVPILFVPVLDEPAGGPDPRIPPAPRERSEGDELERILAPLGRTGVEGLGAGRERLYTRLVEHFVHLARRHPLLLAVDDLPFADRSSLEFLQRLAGEIAEVPLAILATRGDETAVPGPVRELVRAIGRAPSFRTVPLRPLSVAELGEFVTLLQQGAAPAPADVERWHAQTDGNPLFVEQIVRASLGGIPSEGAGTEAHSDLVAVLFERVKSLDDAERRVLTYAAVLGREFDFARLSVVAGMPEERLTEALDRLVAAGLLREKGEEVYEFVSEGVRARVYAELTETRRRILHHRVAVALESRGGVSNFELARQFYLGRDLPKTVEYNLRAAEAATRSYAFETAISHLARALEAERHRPDRDPRREVRLLTELGRLLHETGDLVRSEETLVEAVELARADAAHPVELGRAVLALAWSRFDRGLFPAAEALALEAIDLLQRMGAPRDLLSAHRVLGNVYWRVADLPRAEVHQRLALEIAEREGTPMEQGHALVDVANTLVPQGTANFDSALALYGRAADLFATADDPSARARVLMNRAVLEFGAGRSTDAYRDVAEALQAAERSRSPLWIGYCLLNLAQWRAEDGEVAPARAALDRAAEVLRPLEDRLAVQQIAMTRGMIAEAAGAFDESERDYRRSLESARDTHLVAETSEVLYRLGNLAFRRGDPASARRWLDEATASGIGQHRPDLAPRVTALAESIRSAG